MRAVVWHGPRDVRVDMVSDPIDDLMPLLVGDGDPLGVEDLATHVLPLADAPRGYAMFRAKDDGAIKVVLQPALG